MNKYDEEIICINIINIQYTSNKKYTTLKSSNTSTLKSGCDSDRDSVSLFYLLPNQSFKFSITIQIIFFPTSF